MSIVSDLPATDLTHDAFYVQLNKLFRIGDEPERIEAELIEVSLWNSAPGDPLQPFTVTFRGPPHPALPQRIYEVEGPGLGAVQLFLVPIGPDEVGMRYEAVFS